MMATCDGAWVRPGYDSILICGIPNGHSHFRKACTCGWWVTSPRSDSKSPVFIVKECTKFQRDNRQASLGKNVQESN